MPIETLPQTTEQTKIKNPKMYAVILHNDDYTTMDFVVHILQTIFGQTAASAQSLMLAVHHKGQAAVGVYTYDIAMTKKVQAEQSAQENEFPLLVTVEEAIR